MRARTKKLVAMAALTLSVVFMILTLVLPSVKLPQTEEQIVLGSLNANGTYALRWFDIPPVDAGTKVSVVFGGYRPNSIQFALFPLEGDRTLPPLYYGNVQGTATFSFVAVPNETRPLRLMVLSLNGTGYTLQISSVWSPFYYVRVYMAAALFAIMASAAATYYFRELQIKEEMELSAISQPAEEDRSAASL